MEERTPIYRLLAVYWRRMDEITIAMEHTDSFESGTPEHDAAFAEQGVAGERVTDAEVALAQFVPTQRYEARAKAKFLMQLADGNHGRLEEDVTAALLSSLLDLVDRRASA